MNPPFPPPRDNTLAGCVWLARFLAKARLLLVDQLPPDYVERFGAPEGVDGNFFRFFSVGHEQLMDVIRREPSDEAVARWFLALPGIDADRVVAWNAFAERLGQPGHSMADRLNAVLPTMASRLDLTKIHSIFDLITADEREP